MASTIQWVRTADNPIKFGTSGWSAVIDFKYIGELINEDKIVLGGEESAGMSIRGHVPEKDGIVACLLVAEAIARRGLSLREQIDALFDKVSPLYSLRVNLRLPAEVETRFPQKLARDPERLDSYKLLALTARTGLR